MNNKKQNWKPVFFDFENNLRNALGQQHLAAQLIALVGRYLVPKQPGSGNITMQFITDNEMLIGNKLENGIRIGLQLSRLEINILNSEGKALKVIRLNDKTFGQSLEELKQVLLVEGVNISDLKTEQPYNLPEEFLVIGKFSTSNETAFQNSSNLRYNAELLISELASQFSETIPVRIWPHHFDTGTYFPVDKNEKGEATQTIGLGWAIPDGMVNEPYFYISFWSAKEFSDQIKFKTLPIGEWKTPEWNGAVLSHSQITGNTLKENQYLRANDFFNHGIDQITQLLQSNK